jgi:two-component system sensor kinase FixL
MLEVEMIDSILMRRGARPNRKKAPLVAPATGGFFTKPQRLPTVVGLGAAVATLCLYIIIWHIRVWSTPELLTRVQSILPRAVLITGLMMASLLALVIHLVQTVRFRAREIESLNQKLHNETIESKQVEKVLVESEHRFQLITKNIKETVFVYDMNCKLQYVNPAFEVLTGYTNKELYKADFINYIHPDDKARITQLWERLFQGKGFSGEEFRIVTKDGQTKWYLSSWNPLINKEKKQVGVLGTGLDITERKRVEETLRESEMKFRSVVESANDAIILVNDSGNIISCNKGAQAIFGYTQEELLDKPLDFLISEQHKNDIRLGWFKLTGSKHSIIGRTVELRGLRKNGSEFPLELSLADWKIGEVTFYSGIIRDITERKRTEGKLYEINAALENAVDGISFLDMQGRYLSVNRAYANIFGCNVNEMIGMEWQKTVHPNDLEREINAHKEMLKSGKVKFESRGFRKDGSTFYQEVTIIKNTDKNGQLKGHYRFVRDVTERKMAEERQARLLKELESANQELNDFAYIVSHDLKAPLRAIGSLANWILTDYADKFDKEGKEQMDLLLSRVKRMHDLIEGILQYSRAGRIREEKVEVNLNELVPGVIDMIAPPENVEIKIENELPTILCERIRIQQVFQNLLTNAIKFMDKPKGKIKVGCVEDNGYWRFSIADNGPGIEEKHFAKIFQIFQTLSPRDEFESTGIGLSVVKKIIEMYGGKVWVESKVGYGSTFFFTLPIEETKTLTFSNAAGSRK